MASFVQFLASFDEIVRVFDEFLVSSWRVLASFWLDNKNWRVFGELLESFGKFWQVFGEFLANLWRVLACLTDFLTSFWRVFDEKTHLSNLKCQLKSEIKSQSTLNRQLDIKSYPNHLKSIKIHISSQIILASFWPFLASFASFGEFLEGYWRVLCEFMVSFASFWQDFW